MSAVIVSLGSNLGDRVAHLAAGLQMLDLVVGVSQISSLYRTEPVGRTDQPDFFNLAARLATDDPELALEAAHRAEAAAGRLRSLRWGPRTLDVDVVAAGLFTSADPRLTIPHPRAAERGFVLQPWLDLEPDAVVPGRGGVARLLRTAGSEAVVRRIGPLPGWWRT